MISFITAATVALTINVHIRQDYPMRGESRVDGNVVVTNLTGPESRIELRCVGRPRGSELIVFATNDTVYLKRGQSEEVSIYGEPSRPGPLTIRCEAK